ncbi:hypothetical protein EMGBD4_17040, partial [Verrucomicrobiota bacterium]
MELRDAHCHYQFAEVPYAAVEQARADGVGLAMINGSAPSDWEDVAALGRRDPRNRMSFGLHPWDVPDRARGLGRDSARDSARTSNGWRRRD